MRRRSTCALALAIGLVGCRDVEGWRTTAPAPPRLIEAAVPPIEEADRPRTLVAYMPAAGTVHLELVVRGGHTTDPAGRAGLTRLAGRALTEGISGGDRRAELDRFGDLGTQPIVRVDDDGLSISVLVRPEDAAAAAALLGETLAHPTLDPATFGRVRREAIESLRLLADDPNALAVLGLAHAVLDTAHPTAVEGLGAASQLAAATVDDVRAQLGRLIRADRAALVCVGDVTLDEAKHLAELATAGWPGGASAAAAASRPIAARAPGPRRTMTFVEVEGLSQTVIAVGGIRLSADDPEQPAQSIARDLAGGIVQNELRTERQLSYGVLPVEVSTAGGGMFGLSAKVAPADTRAALDAIFGAFSMVRARGLGGEGIVQARRAQVVREMVAGQSFEVASDIVRDAFEREASSQSWSTRLDRMIAVRGAAVDAAFVRDFDPKRLALVVVGPPSVADALADGRYGRVVRETPDALVGLAVDSRAPASPPPAPVRLPRSDAVP